MKRNSIRSVVLSAKTLQLFFTVLFPSILSILYSCSNTQEFFNTLGLGWNIIIIVVVGMIIPLVGNIIYEVHQQQKKIDKHELLLNVLSGLDNVVDSKRKRFQEAIALVADKETAFTTITQPVKQINILLSALCNVVSNISNARKIKGSIILCNNSDLEDFIAIVGDDTPTITIEELKATSSLAKHVYTTGHAAYISDTNTTSVTPFYKPQYSNTNSIYCYPVKLGSKTCMLVCLTSKDCEMFDDKDIPQLENVMDEFASRLLLEYHLLSLLNATDTPHDEG